MLQWVIYWMAPHLNGAIKYDGQPKRIIVNVLYIERMRIENGQCLITIEL